VRLGDRAAHRDTNDTVSVKSPPISIDTLNGLCHNLNVEHTDTTSKHAAIYLRVSTDEQSTDNQLPQLREFITRKGWELVLEFIDAGVGGGTANREQFQNMFLSAERHEFDVLVFWSLDRFTREGVLPTLQHLERLAKAGVGYASLGEQHLDSTNPFNDVFIAFAASMAKQEKVRISERTKAGLARVRALGTRLGRRPVKEFNLQHALELRGQGHSMRAISRMLDQPVSSVRLQLMRAA